MTEQESEYGSSDARGPDPDATRLLDRVRAGDNSAANELLPLVYDELRRTAGAIFRSERADHTLQPTSLVHEVYARLIRDPENNWNGREHFCAVAALAMRHVLTDYARTRRAQKRGGGRNRERLTHIDLVETPGAVDMLEFEECLRMLASVDPQGSEIAQLWFFGGLKHEEIARVLGISVSTVERRWRRCRALMRAQLDGETR